jgi:hypothetical protein
MGAQNPVLYDLSLSEKYSCRSTAITRKTREDKQESEEQSGKEEIRKHAKKHSGEEPQEREPGSLV